MYDHDAQETVKYIFLVKKITPGFWLLLICVFQILTANDMTCELFGYETEELLGKKLKDLIKLKPKEQATIQECHFDESSGNIVSLAGKVVITAIS